MQRHLRGSLMLSLAVYHRILDRVTSKEGTMMKGNTFKYALAATCCLLVLAALLLLAACGNYSSPGSQPGGTPQATPTGYSIITLLDKELPILLAPHGR